VSTLLLQDGNLYAVVAGGNCYQIKRHADNYIDSCCGMSYFKWQLSTTPLPFNDDLAVTDYCLMLPRRFGMTKQPTLEVHEYCVITSTWRELKDSFEFGYCSGGCTDHINI